MTGYVIAGAAVLLALAVVVYDRWRTARTMRRLDDMLTAAIDGSFSEKTFDESRLSALESRLVRYLAASALSERNIREQKDQISALISDISHQTKTPVANLQLYAQLLSEQPLTPQGKDCAAAISAQADKLQTLIEALVKTSRLETGILALHPQPGEIAPVVEEVVKLLPLLFYLLVFEPEPEQIRPAILTVAAGFATFENICYLIQHGAEHLGFLLIRGFGTGAMHIVCGVIVGYGLMYVWRRGWLKVAGTCGLLGVAVIFHGIYNLLIAYGGLVQYVAYALPVLAVVLGKTAGKGAMLHRSD